MFPLVSYLNIHPKSEAQWVVYLVAQGGDDGFVAKDPDVLPPAGTVLEGHRSTWNPTGKGTSENAKAPGEAPAFKERSVFLGRQNHSSKEFRSTIKFI